MMPRQELKDFFPTISLGQKISAQKDSHMKEYAGSDVELAKRIATLNIMVEFKLVKAEDIAFIKRLLIEQNRATFASSEKTDNFTILSFLLPKTRKKVSLKGAKRGSTTKDTVTLRIPKKQG